MKKTPEKPIIVDQQRKRGQPKKKLASKIPAKRGRPKKAVDEQEKSEEELLSDEFTTSNDENDQNENLDTSQKIELNDTGDDKIGYSRRLFEYQKGHILFLTTTNGEPYDEGARRLKTANKLPHRREYIEGVHTLSRKKQVYIEMCMDVNNQVFVIKQKMKNLLKEVNKKMLENKITNIGVCEDKSIGLILWKDYLKLLRENIDENVKIVVFKNKVTFVEENERDKIFDELHNSPVGGHMGINKSFKRISHKYYWPNMRKDIKERILKCLKCQLHKINRRTIKNPMRITDTPKTPMQKISMDIIGPYRKSPTGNTIVLTIHCLLTKFLVLIPLEDQTAPLVADALINRFICIFGTPEIILTDLGKNFTSDLLKEIARRFRIEKVYTTAYKASSNGSIERTNANLHEFLRHYSLEYNDWDEYVEMHALNHNTNEHDSTGFSPFELMFGRKSREPCVKPRETDQKYGEYYAKLIKKLHLLNEKARENLIKSKERNKLYFDQKARPSDINIGDKVFLKIDRARYKLEPLYEGPFDVLDVNKKSKNVTILYKKKDYVVHLDRLKLAHI